MNNINKNQLVIAGIVITMIIIVVIYIFSIKPQTNENYENLEIEDVSKTEEKVEITKIKVHIAGSVVTEGIIELEEGARVADAIKEAGGTTADANTKKINLAQKLQDGQKIYIPNQNETEEDIMENLGETIEENSINSSSKVNINTATQTELELLSGIGPSIASKIISYRKENGKFKTIEDIKNIPGIGEAKFNSIQDQITV